MVLFSSSALKKTPTRPPKNAVSSSDRRRKHRGVTASTNERPRKTAAQFERNKTSDKVKKAVPVQTDAKKIEIKIKSAGKIDKNVENAVAGGKMGGRRVEITKVKDLGGQETIDCDPDDGGDISSVNEGTFFKLKLHFSCNVGIGNKTGIFLGDLRAQLSRKRAERQKQPLPDVVPSRLLQNALQGVGFKKMNKKTSCDEDENKGECEKSRGGVDRCQKKHVSVFDVLILDIHV